MSLIRRCFGLLIVSRLWSCNAIGQISFTSEELNVGLLTVGQVAPIDGLELINRSSDAVRLVELKASCGCISVAGHPEVLPAGSTTKVPLVTIAAQKVGHFKVQILALGEGATQKAITNIVGWVLPASGMAVQPPAVNFGRSRPEEVKARRLLLLSSHDLRDVVLECSGGFEVRKAELQIGETSNGLIQALQLIVEKSPGKLASGVLTASTGNDRVSVALEIEAYESEPVIPGNLFIDGHSSIWAVPVLLRKGATIGHMPSVFSLTYIRHASDEYDEFLLTYGGERKKGIQEFSLPIEINERLSQFLLRIVIRN